MKIIGDQSALRSTVSLVMILSLLTVLAASITVITCMKIESRIVAQISLGNACLVARNFQTGAVNPSLLELYQYPDCDTLKSGEKILCLLRSDQDARFTLLADSLLAMTTFWLTESRHKQIFLLNYSILPDKVIILHGDDEPLLEVATVKADLLGASLLRLQEYENVWLLRVNWNSDWHIEMGNVKSGSGSANNDIYLINVDRCAIEVTTGGTVEAQITWKGTQSRSDLAFDPPDTIGGFFTVSVVEE